MNIKQVQAGEERPFKKDRKCGKGVYEKRNLFGKSEERGTYLLDKRKYTDEKERRKKNRTH